MSGTIISTFRCNVCDSRTDSSCSLEQAAINAIRCHISLLLHQETCYSATENGIVTRGCTADSAEVLTQCQSDNAICDFCNTTTCNDKEIEADYCYVCDSATDPRCLNQVEEVLYRECTVSPTGITGCYRHEDGKFKFLRISFTICKAYIFTHDLVTTVVFRLYNRSPQEN
jgi:hypothetical protein